MKMPKKAAQGIIAGPFLWCGISGTGWKRWRMIAQKHDPGQEILRAAPGGSGTSRPRIAEDSGRFPAPRRPVRTPSAGSGRHRRLSTPYPHRAPGLSTPLTLQVPAFRGRFPEAGGASRGERVWHGYRCRPLSFSGSRSPERDPRDTDAAAAADRRRIHTPPSSFAPGKTVLRPPLRTKVPGARRDGSPAGRAEAPALRPAREVPKWNVTTG
jgi:hypothetical protein